MRNPVPISSRMSPTVALVDDPAPPMLAYGFVVVSWPPNRYRPGDVPVCHERQARR